MKKFLAIIATAIISSAVFSIVWALAFYTPASELEANTYFWSISELFFIYFFYLTIPFIIGGIIGVIIMDQASKSFNFFKKLPYVANVSLYIIGGIVIGFLSYFIFSDGNLRSAYFIIILSLAFGIIGSLFFLHLYMLARKLLNIS